MLISKASMHSVAPVLFETIAQRGNMEWIKAGVDDFMMWAIAFLGHIRANSPI